MMENNYKKLIFAFVCIAMIGTIASIYYLIDSTGKNLSSGEKRIIITTTTSHIHDLVTHIVGNHAEVKYLMGPGTDPHLYQPVRSDMIKLNKASLIIYNGRHLEGQMSEVFEVMKDKKPVIGLAYSMPSLIKDNKGAYDPHIWMNVQNWITATDIVTKEISELLPEHTSDFKKAAQSYKADLAELEKYIQASIATIPPQNRVLITAHDAFGYLGDAYGLEVIGVQGLSTASEAGLFEIEQLVTRIAQDKIPAIFTESSVSDQNIRAILQGVQARKHPLSFGGMLYSDSLAVQGSEADTYIGMMRHNIQTITKALGGKVLDYKQYKEASIKLAP